MAASYLHGVEIVEVEKGLVPINVVRSAVIGLVGIAPSGPVNELTLVQSEADAAQFGAEVPGFSIPQALSAIFAQGAGTVLVVNTFNAATNTATVTDESVTVTNSKFKTAHAPLSDVVVTSDPAGTTFTKGTDYDFDAFGNFTIIPGGAVTEGASLLVDYKRLDASTVTSAQIIGTIDGSTEVRTGFKMFGLAYNLFGFEPRLFIAPGYSQTAAVKTEMISVAENIKGHALIDAAVGETVAEVIADRGPAGTIFNTSSKRAILCYPHVKAYDAATDSNINKPLSQYLAGVIARTDLQLGYWFSPSNKEIFGIVGLERNLTANVSDANSQVNLLNAAGILTVFNSFGTGFRVWGNRSAAFPTSTAPDNFIPVRRVADIINESITQFSLAFIDKPINRATIDSVVESVNGFLRQLQARGAIVDGRCYYDNSLNTPADLAAGNLTFSIEFMPPTPAERITYQSFINVNLLTALNA